MLYRLFIAEPLDNFQIDLSRATERHTSQCVLNTSVQVSGLLVCRDKDIFRCQLGETHNQPILLKADIVNLYIPLLKISYLYNMLIFICYF